MTFYFFRNVKAKMTLYLVLSKIFGVGDFIAKNVIQFFALPAVVLYGRVSSLKLRKIIFFLEDEFYIDIHLKRILKNNMKIRLNIVMYQALRISFRLPSRGQRTKSNGSTAKRLNFVKN